MIDTSAIPMGSQGWEGKLGSKSEVKEGAHAVTGKLSWGAKVWDHHIFYSGPAAGIPGPLCLANLRPQGGKPTLGSQAEVREGTHTPTGKPRLGSQTGKRSRGHEP